MTAAPFPAATIAAARDAAREQLRIAGHAEDALIDRLCTTAMTLAEAFTGTALIARDHVATMGVAAEWRALPTCPVRAITAGADVAAIDIDADGTGWVRMTAAGEVRFVAGMADDWTALPPPIAHGVIVLVAHLFDTRERDAAPPAAVGALWRPWRRMRLGEVRR
ncbi:hypothetical protein [Sphingomonas sp. CFBP 13720]|uniref:hypothetical protein n=1 Tax=Sphingomonas sp. CFBP 13720 TaxID=2775302 RepID=UPI0017812310|nr:hypothetical protein [Sphingomonas sp. CFBP 13720]MBD8679836.1 hypothetical protein [Sphingomonas sp. CFBP 13720]